MIICKNCKARYPDDEKESLKQGGKFRCAECCSDQIYHFEEPTTENAFTGVG